MNRPKRVREVYVELQHAVGEIASASALLKAASDIVDLLEPVDQEAPGFGLRTGGLPFEQWALDRAMADGGWRVMSLESDVISQLYADERDVVTERLELEHWLTEHAA